MAARKDHRRETMRCIPVNRRQGQDQRRAAGKENRKEIRQSGRSPSSSNRMHDGFVGSRERDRISRFSWLSELSGHSRHPSLERDASHRQFTGNQPRVFCGRRGRASGRAPFIRRCHRRIISPAARCVGLATKPNIGRPDETNTWLACVINTPRNDFEKIEASAAGGAAGSRARTIYGRRRNLKNDRSVARQVR